MMYEQQLMFPEHGPLYLNVRNITKYPFPDYTVNVCGKKLRRHSIAEDSFDGGILSSTGCANHPHSFASHVSDESVKGGLFTPSYFVKVLYCVFSM